MNGAKNEIDVSIRRSQGKLQATYLGCGMKKHNVKLVFERREKEEEEHLFIIDEKYQSGVVVSMKDETSFRLSISTKMQCL